MASSLINNAWQLPAVNNAATRHVPWINSTRCSFTYEVDLITFHAFYNLITRVGESPWTNMRELKLSVGLDSGHKVEINRVTQSVVSKRTPVAFCGASKASQGEIRPFITELLVLLHPYVRQQENLVKAVGFAWDGPEDLEYADYNSEIWPVLQIEFGDHGTMKEFFACRSLKEDLSLRRSLCHDVATGLTALHKCSIVHGDIKPDNILIFRADSLLGFVAKICDFGFSLIVNPNDQTPVSLPGHTLPWTAPEAHPEATKPKSASAFFSSDIYSLGLVVWSAFTVDGDPFNLGGQKTSPWVEKLKNEDLVAELASSTTKTVLESLRLRSKSLGDAKILVDDLSKVFKSTLGLVPQSRSLSKAIDALTPDKPSVDNESDKIKSSTVLEMWPQLFYRPMQMLSAFTDLTTLKGRLYHYTPGSRGVARASVSTCERLWSRRHLETPITLSDAAVFLFRSYLEGYGVTDSSDNFDKAVGWLSKALEAEIENDGDVAPWVLEVDLIYEQLGRPMPALPGLKELIHRSVVAQLTQPFYQLQAMERVSTKHGILFDPVFNAFRANGLLQLEIFDRWARTTVQSTSPHYDDSTLTNPEKCLTRNGYTLLHLAASCGNLELLKALYEASPVNLDIADENDITPIMLAAHYSHLNVFEWLAQHHVKTKHILGPALSSFLILQNFRVEEQPRVAAALEIDSDVNGLSMLLFHPSWVYVLSWAAMNRKQTILRALLDLKPNQEACRNALGWAAKACQLDSFFLIEKHLREHFHPQETETTMSQYLLWAIQPGVFSRVCNGSGPKFRECIELFCQRTGEFSDTVLFTWFGQAAANGDLESFDILVQQPGLEALTERRRSENPTSMLRGLLETTLMFDQKRMFDRLLARDYAIQVKQFDELFPTLFHAAAYGEFINGPAFVESIAEHGEDISKQSGEQQSYCSALEIAISCGNIQVADSLIRHGAPMDYETTPPSSPLMNLVCDKTSKAVPRIKFLLNHQQQSPKFVYDPKTKLSVLHRAAGPAFSETTSWMNKASVIEGPKAILTALLEHYKDPKYLNARTNMGATPLHFACFMGCDWAVRLLLDAGADATLPNCQGFAPLHLALPTTSTRFYSEFYGKIDRKNPAYGVVSMSGRKRCVDILIHDNPGFPKVGFTKLALGIFGFIDLSKDDDAEYESWPLEANPRIAKFLVRRRNLWYRKRAQEEERGQLKLKGKEKSVSPDSGERP